MGVSHGRSVRGSLKRVLTWVAGFVLTGRVFHGLRWRDVRNTEPATALFEVASFVVVCTVGWWAVFIIPHGILALVVGVPLGLVAVRVVVVTFQLAIVELINATQYLYGAHDMGLRRYLFSRVRRALGV